MKQDDRWAGCIPGSDFEHVECRARDLDRLSLGRKTVLKSDNAGLGRQRQDHERGDEKRG